MITDNDEETIASSGKSLAAFFTSPTDDSVQFTDVYECIDAIAGFVLGYASWGDPPLLSPPSVCPILDFETSMFSYAGEQWECL